MNENITLIYNKNIISLVSVTGRSLFLTYILSFAALYVMNIYSIIIILVLVSESFLYEVKFLMKGKKEYARSKKAMLFFGVTLGLLSYIINTYGYLILSSFFFLFGLAIAIGSGHQNGEELLKEWRNGEIIASDKPD